MARMLHLSRFPSSFPRILGVAAVSLMLTGCVSQEKYNALKLERDGLAEQLGRSQSDGQSARAEADSYKSQLAQLMNNGQGQSALANNLTAQLAALQTNFDDLNRRYAEAMQRSGTATALPAPLTNELQTFANQNPELVDFDAARGIVKFKSDLTFAPGDAALTPQAKAAITKFATILNSATASGYELMVAGHTDNMRVSNPATIAKGHRDNWYLSAHRAISVGDELIAEHVSPNRLGVTGYADQRPIASNVSAAGQAQNRRVEVLILPTQVHGSAIVAASKSEPSVVRKVAARPAMNKDTPAVSAFNK